MVLLWVPCFAVAHYALASEAHYVTGVGNLAVNVGLALVCGPALADLVALADALVARRLLPTHQGGLVKKRVSVAQESSLVRKES